MNSFPILMYHQIVSGEPADIHAVTIEAFANQMQWLSNHGYQGVTVEDLLLDRAFISGEPNSRPIAITFDDGYLDFYTNAFPILQQYRFKATVFLVAERISGVNDWDQVPGLAGAPLLNGHQIREIAGNGFSLGAHTCTHPNLASLPIAQAEYEIQASRKIIEKELQKPVRAFAYPYSGYTDEVVKIVSENGYELACTYVPHYVGGSGKRRYELQRTGVLATDSLENFAGKVRANPLLRLRKLWRDFRTSR